jgi:hypothetical protein
VCLISGAIIAADASKENDASAHFSGRNYIGGAAAQLHP